MMDEMLSLVIVGLCIAAFLIILLGVGSFFGGDWELVAQGVASFIMVIVGFVYGCIVVTIVMGKK